MTPARLLLTLLLAVPLAACSSAVTSGGSQTDLPPPTASDRIDVIDNAFTPATAEVAAGEEVVWDFGPADRAHDVVFDGDRRSQVMQHGTWVTTFDAPGTYAYRCTLHPGMDGTIVVTDS